MTRTAFIVGGTGQTGTAIARTLAKSGWSVVVSARGERKAPAGDFEIVRLDRNEPGSLKAAIGDGVDLLVDVVPFRLEDAEQLLRLGDRCGAVIAISSASVYADESGRSLDEAQTPAELPLFRAPIGEDQATVLPGPETYSTRKVAIEQRLLAGAVPTTILRPCAVYGPRGSLSREWHFVKRFLDGRPFIVVAGRGAGVFHTTSVENLAELVRLAADNPADRILNCGDPDPPDVLTISRAIAEAVGGDWDEILLPDFPQAWDEPGVTPWGNSPTPFVLDMSKAELELGYAPVVQYGDAVEPVCEWLLEATRGRDWREVLPTTAHVLAQSFDYDAEDALVATS
jgi:nucleoside-diphosphate-sugar epimerase